MDAITFYSSVISPHEYFLWDYSEEYSKALPDFIISNIKRSHLDRKRTFIDIGCGPGTTLRPIMEHFKFATCIAVDASPRMLEFIGKEKTLFPFSITAQCRDVATELLEVDTASVWLVMSCNLVKFLSRIEFHIQEVSRIVTSNGYWAVNIPLHETSRAKNVVVIDEDSSHPAIRIFKKTYLLRLFKKHSFEIVSSEQEDEWVDNQANLFVKKMMFLLKKN